MSTYSIYCSIFNLAWSIICLVPMNATIVILKCWKYRDWRKIKIIIIITIIIFSLCWNLSKDSVAVHCPELGNIKHSLSLHSLWACNVTVLVLNKTNMVTKIDYKILNTIPSFPPSCWQINNLLPLYYLHAWLKHDHQLYLKHCQ